MSVNNAPTHSMSDEEAKQEHDEIQREIAEKKGKTYKPDGEDPKEKKETVEPAEDKDPEEIEESKDDEVPEDTDPDNKDNKDVDPEDPDYSKPRKKSLLGKYQSEKKTWQTEKVEMQKQIDDLTTNLNRTQTAEKMKEKVKAYAEKHEMSEDAVMDLILLQKEAVQPDPDVRKTLEESQALVQKNKAIEAFENEFGSLIEDVPEAAELREKIRVAAYKEENLEKSLFEIYHRMTHEAKPAKKKTGESQRGAPSREARATTFDVRAVADKVKSGQSGALQGLTGEQSDEVFALLDKEGSRYS